MNFDIIINNGILYDGSGKPGKLANIGIRNGYIEAIDQSLTGDASININAEGLAVAPGFIDIKTHSDFTLPVNPTADSKVLQGVTTEIIGHCGFSIAPITQGKTKLLRDYLIASAPWIDFKETSFKAYMDNFPNTSINPGMLIGHNTMRLMAMGMEERAPTGAELGHMTEMLEEGLDAGALGFSTGLFTTPGSYANSDEITSLCKIVKKYNSCYFSHIRDESNQVLNSVQEAIDIAEKCDIHVQIVHFKASGLDNWGKAQKVLEMIQLAKNKGLKIDLDLYPYTAGTNPLRNLLPQWVHAGGQATMIERIRSDQVRAKIREDINKNGFTNWGRLPSWDSIQLVSSSFLSAYVGKSILAIANERGEDPLDTACDALSADLGATRVIIFSISEDDVRLLVKSPIALTGSDGNCIACSGITHYGKPHPRFFGTFPRIIGHYVDELKLLPLELAIHKMTGATANALNLKQMGFLKEGYRADVTIFDPKNFKELATYQDPFQPPSGSRTTVINNGQLVVENARHTGAKPGRILRRSKNGLAN